jgi:hypothetical protein
MRHHESLAEKEHAENIMQGVSVDTLARIGGLLVSLVAFALLVAGYVLIVDKRPMRSDFVFYFFMVNVALLIGMGVIYYYKKDREIEINLR